MPIETFIQMGSAVHSSVNGLLTFALLIIAPFNIFKYALTSLIVFVITRLNSVPEVLFSIYMGLRSAHLCPHPVI